MPNNSFIDVKLYSSKLEAAYRRKKFLNQNQFNDEQLKKKTIKNLKMNLRTINVNYCLGYLLTLI